MFQAMMVYRQKVSCRNQALQYNVMSKCKLYCGEWSVCAIYRVQQTQGCGSSHVVSGEISVQCLRFNIFFFWRLEPTRVMASSFFRYLDHTQRCTTVCRTPLDEWSACRKDLSWQHTTLTTNKHLCPWWDSNPRLQQASGRRPTS
jgi:hypothetical protein